LLRLSTNEVSLTKNETLWNAYSTPSQPAAFLHKQDPQPTSAVACNAAADFIRGHLGLSALLLALSPEGLSFSLLSLRQIS
jgi:hypothetical protein